MPVFFFDRREWKHVLHGNAGTTKAELCAEHAMNIMVNVRDKRCGRRGCTRFPSYGKAAPTRRNSAPNMRGTAW